MCFVFPMETGGTLKPLLSHVRFGGGGLQLSAVVNIQSSLEEAAHGSTVQFSLHKESPFLIVKP